MSSLYQHTKDLPFHISVGAVLVDKEGRICTHAFAKDTLSPRIQQIVGDRTELYLLMRESLEAGETLEQAVVRGIREEFGAEGVVKKYLGSITGPAFDTRSDVSFEKNTPYFEVSLTSLGDRPKDDAESHSTLRWMEPQELRAAMALQASPFRNDLDESKIIDAYLKYGDMTAGTNSL